MSDPTAAIYKSLVDAPGARILLRDIIVNSLKATDKNVRLACASLAVNVSLAAVDVDAESKVEVICTIAAILPAETEIEMSL